MCSCSQAVRSASRARKDSAETAFAFRPRIDAVCSRVRPSTSVYHSTCCHRSGRDRNARAVADPSKLRTEATSAPRSPITSSIASPAAAVLLARTMDT